MRELSLFAMNSSKEFGQKIAEKLGIELSSHEEKYFQDGEVYCASLENVRGKDVFVVQSLFTDEHETVNSKIMKLLIFIGSLRDASAERVTVVCPYLCYSRQDRKIQSRSPISTKYLAKILTSVGADRLLTIDVHNPTSIQNSYSICADLLEANILFAKYLKTNNIYHNLVVMSPDAGGLARARKFRKIVQQMTGESIGLACLDKIHDGDLIKANDIMGDVEDKNVIVLDDLISSGKTVLECVETCSKKRSRGVMVMATHGLFVGDCERNLSHERLTSIVISDTIKPFRVANSSIFSKMKIIPTTELFSEAIKRIHKNESLSELLAKNGK
jgi:ribose-phosphate pyrophosphokinase